MQKHVKRDDVVLIKYPPSGKEVHFSDGSWTNAGVETKLYSDWDTKESWVLTTKDGMFRFWCAMFHTKHHDLKNCRDGYYRKHRCKKCKVVYLAPNSNFLNQL